MKVLIFGASGGTGKELVKQCFRIGYKTSAFVYKNSKSLEQFGIELEHFKGDVKDERAVDVAIKGKDAVLVALGVIPGRTNKILSEGTYNIVQSMKKHGVKRLITETGAIIMEDDSKMPILWRLMSSMPPMRGMFEDKRIQEKIIINSGLDWVIVRPATLTNGPLSKKYTIGESVDLKTTSMVSRANVAHFMVAQINSDKWLGKSVIITSKD